MGQVKLPYYQVKRERGFFVLGAERAKAAGWFRADGSPLASIPLGPDGPAAWTAAKQRHEEYIAALAGNAHAATAYPRGSLGAWYDYFRSSEAFARKKARTREDYERGWKHVKALAHRRIDLISVAEFEGLQLKLEAGLSPSERYRAVKVAKALFNAAVRANVIGKSPALTLPNPQPHGRSGLWTAAEINRWSAGATEQGYAGIGIAIRIMWETAFSPVDARTLPLSARRKDASGAWFEIGRTKTRREAFGAISKALCADIDAYAAGLGFELGTSPLVRRPDGLAYTEKNLFAKHARIVREVVFPADRRQLLDIRRSANVEAALGGATPEERAEILANNLDKNSVLEATYTPGTVAMARQVAEKRLAGRAVLAREMVR